MNNKLKNMMELYAKIICEKDNIQSYHANYKCNNKWFYCNLINYDDTPKDFVLIDKEKLCPKYRTQYTLFNINNVNDFKYYYKCPLSSFTEYDSNSIVSMEKEIEAYEKIKKYGEHKNICKYYGCIVDNKIVESIVLEKYDNCLMYIDKINREQKENIIKGIEDGINFLHNINIVHGDINPYNIMLDKDMNPIIIDFDSCGKNNLKMGTGEYMSNNYQKEKKDDIYSLNKTIEYINNIDIER